MSLLLDRSRRSDPYLEWKVRIFTVAAVLGLGGIYLEVRWMGAVAIVLLAVAMMLRFLPGRGERAGEGENVGETDAPDDVGSGG